MNDKWVARYFVKPGYLLPHDGAAGILDHVAHLQAWICREINGTISVGVASRVPRLGESSATLVQEADAAMYQAKHQGRNQVVLAQ